MCDEKIKMVPCLNPNCKRRSESTYCKRCVDNLSIETRLKYLIKREKEKWKNAKNGLKKPIGEQ